MTTEIHGHHANPMPKNQKAPAFLSAVRASLHTLANAACRRRDPTDVVAAGCASRTCRPAPGPAPAAARSRANIAKWSALVTATGLQATTAASTHARCRRRRIDARTPPFYSHPLTDHPVPLRHRQRVRAASARLQLAAAGAGSSVSIGARRSHASSVRPLSPGSSANAT